VTGGFAAPGHDRIKAARRSERKLSMGSGSENLNYVIDFSLRIDMRKLVGQNVRRIWLEKGLTQEQFCDLSGFSQQYVSGLETGRRNPTIVMIYELAEALGVGHLDLLQPAPRQKRGS
jgi:DNA-binding XRE family transcriptional regulator